MAKKKQNNYIETPRKSKRFRDMESIDDFIQTLKDEQKSRDKAIKKMKGLK